MKEKVLILFVFLAKATALAGVGKAGPTGQANLRVLKVVILACYGDSVLLF